MIVLQNQTAHERQAGQGCCHRLFYCKPSLMPVCLYAHPATEPCTSVTVSNCDQSAAISLVQRPTCQTLSPLANAKLSAPLASLRGYGFQSFWFWMSNQPVVQKVPCCSQVVPVRSHLYSTAGDLSCHCASHAAPSPALTGTGPCGAVRMTVSPVRREVRTNRQAPLLRPLAAMCLRSTPTLKPLTRRQRQMCGLSCPATKPTAEQVGGQCRLFGAA